MVDWFYPKKTKGQKTPDAVRPHGVSRITFPTCQSVDQKPRPTPPWPTISRPGLFQKWLGNTWEKRDPKVEGKTRPTSSGSSFFSFKCISMQFLLGIPNFQTQPNEGSIKDPDCPFNITWVPWSFSKRASWNAFLSSRKQFCIFLTWQNFDILISSLKHTGI